MKKSKSAPSLTRSTPSVLKRNSGSCNALSSLDMIPQTQQYPTIEENVVFVSKVPFTQVYQCFTKASGGGSSSPPLISSAETPPKELDKDLASCMATPPDPIEEEPNLFARESRNSIDFTMARYQLWWERVKRSRERNV